MNLFFSSNNHFKSCHKEAQTCFHGKLQADGAGIGHFHPKATHHLISLSPDACPTLILFCILLSFSTQSSLLIYPSTQLILKVCLPAHLLTLLPIQTFKSDFRSPCASSSIETLHRPLGPLFILHCQPLSKQTLHNTMQPIVPVEKFYLYISNYWF